MELGNIIAERPNKIIYQSGDSLIKVFSTDFSPADILNEALNQARIEETGLNIPKILSVTMIDGKWAIITEFIEGKTLAQLMEDMNEGLVITDVSGLHAGANAISGDFSLLSKGYTIEGGKRGHAVEQITVAGNFYELLKNIRAVGSDLLFPGSSTGSPSVDVGVLQVSGK